MRFIDILGSALGLILLSPLLVLIAILVRLSSPGPVFHRAVRVGKGGAPFRLYKFRTMVVGAAQAGPGVTVGGDPRITPLGRLLRRYKLDELPQLINVLKGEMSLVGPRPEDPRYVAHYNAAQRRVLRVPPGITSAASLRYRHEESILAAAADWESAYINQILPEKLAIDLAYLQTRTLFTDLTLILQTLLAVFK